VCARVPCALHLHKAQVIASSPLSRCIHLQWQYESRNHYRLLHTTPIYLLICYCVLNAFAGGQLEESPDHAVFEWWCEGMNVAQASLIVSQNSLAVCEQQLITLPYISAAISIVVTCAGCAATASAVQI
jgi:hypothetical protein